MKWKRWMPYRRLLPLQKQILALEAVYAEKSDCELQAETERFRKQLQEGQSLDAILVPAFACVREAAWRILGEKPYPVQILGGLALHQGMIAEMQTGEGKTLTALMPAYLNALTGNGVHVVTVNPYLAARDQEKMEAVYRFLGLSVGLVVDGMEEADRKAAYAKDITYTTNDQLGFDYLRDHLAADVDACVQRGFSFAIVDEVDSILIDEARTPLIIAGERPDQTAFCQDVDAFVRTLAFEEKAEWESDELAETQSQADVVVDLKKKRVIFTVSGMEKAQDWFSVRSLAAPEHAGLLHQIQQSLQAHGILKRDQDYVIKGNEILLVDEFTGRVMEGRRYQDGLHQAIEAKEGVPVQMDNRVQASITYQNFFRLYEKLSGMTGTADTEKEEFWQTYHLPVLKIPTNRPCIRTDLGLRLYRTQAEKEEALVAELLRIHQTGQPVLVGTTSVEQNERLADCLRQAGLTTFRVLNAKNDAEEAEIIAAAGTYGSVTIATNMAGRGTDILLGGNPVFEARKALRRTGNLSALLCQEAPDTVSEEEIDLLFSEMEWPDAEQSNAARKANKQYRAVLAKKKEQCRQEGERIRALGGLYVIGTELQESRRVDRQLCGRAGRQGDPGGFVCYASFEDSIVRQGGEPERLKKQWKPESDRTQKRLQKKLLQAQLRVEGLHQESRKQILRYDDVLQEHRQAFYELREQVLACASPESLMHWFATAVTKRYLDLCLPANRSVEERMASFSICLQRIQITFPQEELKDAWNKAPWYRKQKTFLEPIVGCIVRYMEEAMNLCREQEGDSYPAYLQQMFLLANLDAYWEKHLEQMEYLKRGIVNRVYGMQDPVVQYKKEAAVLFEEMLFAIKEGTLRQIIGACQVIKQHEETNKRKVEETYE